MGSFSNVINNVKQFILLIDEIGIGSGKQLQMSEDILGDFKINKSTSLSVNISRLDLDQLSDESLCNRNNSAFILQHLNMLFIKHDCLDIFTIIKNLKNNNKAYPILGWFNNCQHQSTYDQAYLEELADCIIYVRESSSEISLEIYQKKLYNSITRRKFILKISTKQHKLHEIEIPNKKVSESVPSVCPDEIGTFKIGLKEDEIRARNALVLPFEKVKELDGVHNGQIHYIPEKIDDIDEEDPDDDLDV